MKLKTKQKIKDWTIRILSIVFLLWAIETKNIVIYILGMTMFTCIIQWTPIKKYAMSWYYIIKIEWDKGKKPKENKVLVLEETKNQWGK